MLQHKAAAETPEGREQNARQAYQRAGVLPGRIACAVRAQVPELRRRNGAGDTVQVIEKLIQLAKTMRAANRRGEQLGMSEEELAFHDALEPQTLQLPDADHLSI
jgi:hypothetical protein